MATDITARGLAKRNEVNLDVKTQEIVDKAVDIKVNTIEVSNSVTSLNQAEDGFVNVDSIKGKTVQNLIKKEDFNIGVNTSNATVQVANDGRISVTPKNEIRQFVGSYGQTSMKIVPTKVYTLIFEVVENTLNTTVHLNSYGGVASIYFGDNNIESGFVGTKKYVMRNGEGVGKTLIDTSYWLSIGYNGNSNLSGKFIFRPMILEGDWTDKEVPSYFEGIKSVGESEGKLSVKSVGKNLFNVKDYINDVNNKSYYALDSNGDLIVNVLDTRSFGFTHMIYLDAGVYNLNTTNAYNIRAYYSNEPYFKANNVSQLFNANGLSEATLILNKSGYIALKFVIDEKYHLTPFKIGKVQLEKNDKPSLYEQPIESKLELSFEPLCSLPNGVCDEIVGDKLIRRVGRIVLNGSEDWTVNGNNQSYGLIVRDLGGSATSGGEVSNIICDKLSVSMQANLFQGTKTHTVGAIGGDTNKLYIRLDGSYTTVNSIKTWLSSNNVTIHYELLNPIETTISLPSLKSFKNGSIYLQNSITPDVKISYPTNLASRVFLAEKEYERASVSVDNYWKTLLILADKELKMKSIQPLTTETMADMKNKLNQIMNAWK